MEERLLTIVNNILSNNGKDEIAAIEMSHSVRKDLGFDSFDLAELTVRIEDEFGVDIFEKGLVDSIEEIIHIIKKSDS